MKPLNHDDLMALIGLEFEMPSIRKSVELAECLSRVTKTNPPKHPVLLFVFDRAVAAIIENLLLRAYEIAELLDRAASSLGFDPVMVGSHRSRKAAVPVLDLALALRHERVAHRVKMKGVMGPAWTRLSMEYTSVWVFLNELLAYFGKRVAQVRDAGVLNRDDLNAARRYNAEFNDSDVTALVDAANALVARKPAA